MGTNKGRNKRKIRYQARNSALNERAKRQAKGLMFQWQEEDPLSLTENGILGDCNGVTHRNPIFAMKASQIFLDHSKWFMTQRFKWSMTLTAVMLTGDGPAYEHEARCKFEDLGDQYQDTIAALFDEIDMDFYVHIRMEAEIIGV